MNTITPVLTLIIKHFPRAFFLIGNIYKSAYSRNQMGPKLKIIISFEKKS